MTQSKRFNLYKRAINTFGLGHQKMKTIEECAELIDALCKNHELRLDDAAVVSEIADVIIMAEQMAVAFGYDAVMAEAERKLDRLYDLVEEQECEKYE